MKKNDEINTKNKTGATSSSLSRRLGWILPLFLLFSLSIQAQLLWKISGKDLTKPSYLFGTHHLIPISFLDSVPGLFKAFGNCETVVGEMILNNIDANAQIMQAAMLPQGITMDSLLKKDDYTLVDAELKAVLKFGLKELGLMNPSIIRTMYELEVYKHATGHSEDVQSDSYFQLVAGHKNMKIIGLEGIEEQINLLFGNKDLKREAQLLVETIRHKTEIVIQINTLNNAYRAGKIEKLVDLAKKQDDKPSMTDEEYTAMIDNRNFNWLKLLPCYMKESSCFIAVGALHLGGENGLVKQLRKKGYKVRRVKK